MKMFKKEIKKKKQLEPVLYLAWRLEAHRQWQRGGISATLLVCLSLSSSETETLAYLRDSVTFRFSTVEAVCTSLG